MRLRADCVIIGGGFAGIATAYQLTRRGASDVMILEQEKFPGVHSSGRNAGMIRQVIFDEEIAKLAREGAAFVREASSRWNLPHLFRPTGSLLLGGESCWHRLQAAEEEARRQGTAVEIWDKQAVESRLQMTAGGDFEGGVFTASDGTVDAHGLLQSYLREAEREGARLLSDCKVEAVIVDDGYVTGVHTDHGRIKTPCVVNAAGAWAARIGSLAAAAAVPLVPHRRHLFFTGGLPEPRYDGPFLWNEEHHVYLRSESGGLLLSPCDETPFAPGIPPTTLEAAELLAAKLQRAFPSQMNLPVARSWAGLRTFTPDGRFVIGPDPLVTGFFWVAGLGGHGVTTSAAVGRLAADLILEPSRDADNAFSPARFVAQHERQRAG